MNQPAKYRKLPVVIEAMWWDGSAEQATPIIDWVLSNGGTATYDCTSDTACSGTSAGHTIGIHTLEDVMQTVPGAWVIRGVQGEFYPCAIDIFAATYERVDEPADTNHDLPGNGHCRSCSEPIAWYRTPTGKRMPLDPAPSADGNVVVDGGVAVALSADALADSDPSVPRYLSHFATCPDAKSWRGNGGQS